MQVMLDGTVGEVTGLERKVEECKRAEIRQLVIPASNSNAVKSTADFHFIGVDTVSAAMSEAVDLFQRDGKCSFLRRFASSTTLHMPSWITLREWHFKYLTVSDWLWRPVDDEAHEASLSSLASRPLVEGNHSKWLGYGSCIFANGTLKTKAGESSELVVHKAKVCGHGCAGCLIGTLLRLEVTLGGGTPKSHSSRSPVVAQAVVLAWAGRGAYVEVLGCLESTHQLRLAHAWIRAHQASLPELHAWAKNGFDVMGDSCPSPVYATNAGGAYLVAALEACSSSRMCTGTAVVVGLDTDGALLNGFTYHNPRHAAPLVDLLLREGVTRVILPTGVAGAVARQASGTQLAVVPVSTVLELVQVALPGLLVQPVVLELKDVTAAVLLPQPAVLVSDLDPA